MEVRSRFLLTRPLSYKTLNDKKKWEALPFFLAAAALLEGVAITFLVDKRLKSIFAPAGKLDLAHPQLHDFASWKSNTVEKMLRVTHLAALLVAGLSGERQTVVWITDQDDIVANEERLKLVTNTLARVSSHLLDHSLSHLRVGTTASDDGSKQLEDFNAIADLCAGAVVDVLDDLASKGAETSAQILLPASPRITRKCRAILTWLTSPSTMPLTRVVIAIEPDGTDQIIVKRMVFDRITT